MSTSEVEAYVKEGERRQARWALYGTLAAGIVALIVVTIAFLINSNKIPADDERALSALHSAGFRDAKLGGTDAFACEESESSRHFSAINPAGTRVEGTVCCGLARIGKGCTIRWGR